MAGELDRGAGPQKGGQSYKAAVGNALQTAQDVLGSLGLEPEPPSAEQAVQEVEVNCYDSDSLSSPPTSSGEESEGEIDPLLDFSRDDELTYRPGKPMIYNVLKTQRALGGLKTITHEIQEAKQRKAEEALAERQRTQVLVAAEASFTPSFKGKKAVPESSLPQKPEPFHREKQLPVAASQQHSRTGTSPPLPAAVSRIEPRTSPGAKLHEAVEDKQHPAIATQRQRSSVSPPPVVPRMEPIAKPKAKVPPPFYTKKPNTMESKQLQDLTTERVRKFSPPPSERMSPPPAVLAVSERINQPSPPAAVSGRKSSPVEDLPPPVPPYNPHGPKTDVWTKKPREGPEAGHVRVRVKKRSGEYLPTSEREGHVADPGYKRKFSPPAIQPTPRKLPESVHDWRLDDVGVWLKQIDLALYDKYFPCFRKHDTTGPTVMRLNESKLKNMGISHTKHRRLLAKEAARLKIQQEALELKELEEETEITYL